MPDRQRFNVSGDDIFYACDCADLIIDEVALPRYLAGMDDSMKVTEKEIESAEDQLRIKQLRVARFFENYPDGKVAEAIERVKGLALNVAAIKH